MALQEIDREYGGGGVELEALAAQAAEWAQERRARADDLIHNAAPGHEDGCLVAANTELLLAQGVEKFFAAITAAEGGER